ncbi:hypothetical protein [Microvirga brassicacearum]|uniref:calcium-binding protein n=1 Tax=Microvirga brassicacearum TaxID=2580413 RepID=UPI001293A5BD
MSSAPRAAAFRTTSFSGTGNELSNLIVGGDGNDTLDGGGATSDLYFREDTLIGGDGDDLYRLDVEMDYNTIVTEGLDQGIETVEYRGQTYGANLDMADNVEKAVFIGTGDVQIIGNIPDNMVTSGAGNDTLNGGDGNDTLIGGEGDNWYVINSADDVMIELKDGELHSRRLLSGARCRRPRARLR